jgi:hypothetical protein
VAFFIVALDALVVTAGAAGEERDLHAGMTA